ncbi:DUF1223 domain-containing protein [Thalassovita sp.]|jgi:hypothetical protein|uniref:DUF1223 domain-containing protein n=1 Tax=Thalassovita sp. TaxID=1979401 RepID=UPI003B5A7AD6
MRKLVRWIAAAFLGVAALPAMADDHPVLVELYTSQGCSSCPPADAFMNKLAKRDDVIALALHVDYWDYIGWPDEFAQAKFTKRQKSYAVSAGRRSIYTPQMIVGGQEHVVGNHPMDVNDLIRKHAAKEPAVSVGLKRQGDRLTITASADRPLNEPLLVQMVRYMPGKQVMIRRGENAGRTIQYSNIVTDWKLVGEWDPRAPLSTTGKITGDAPVVVIVQRHGPGEVLATARLR